MTTQPEALRLADALDFWPQSECSEAAALLRRQHDEIERLMLELSAYQAVALPVSVFELIQERDKAHEALRVALEALDRVKDYLTDHRTRNILTDDITAERIREDITKIKEVL